ncbi:urease accessory protein UreH domain-containing protein [Candidatus Lokiarchaeum ossiferum]|uniref:urease accessory protein UreH domain-containing protein n=1 Tax=Candidatus Lokiarchaeum ossiferum TaxID=2951803 RepID=UPI00352F179D
MILAVPWASGGFFFIIWTGFFLGVLHTIMPCEDKFVFCFYAFGVARDWKQAFRIVNFYGAGLFIMNLILGTIITWFSKILVETFSNIEPAIWNYLVAFSLTLSGIIMIYQIRKKTYWPHSDQFQELTESISTLRAKKRTALLLGLLAGIPPCIFELGVYFEAAFLAGNYGWGNGVWIIFFFGIGTWLGLYPLVFIGTMSGKLSKSMKNSSIQRLQQKIKNKIRRQKKVVDEESEDILEKDEISSYSKLEYFSAWSLIGIGGVFLLFGIFKVELVPAEDVTHVPWPFNDDTLNIFWIIFFSLIGLIIVLIFLTLWSKNKKYVKSIETNEK